MRNNNAADSAEFYSWLREVRSVDLERKRDKARRILLKAMIAVESDDESVAHRACCEIEQSKLGRI